MKELTIEEKAKAYDNLIERLKDFQFEYRFSAFSDTIEKYFPELEGSEDERIRKSLSAYFAKFKPNDMWDADFSFGDIVTWLEKQGEKSVDKLRVNDELYEHIRETCACIDDALSSKTTVDMTDYLEMAERSAQSAFDMIEKQNKQEMPDEEYYGK